MNHFSGSILGKLDFADPMVLLVMFIILFVFSTIILLIKRYKRCPSNKVLVVYGKVGGGGASPKCMHGGGSFIWPADSRTTTTSISSPSRSRFPLRGALSIENIRVNVPSSSPSPSAPSRP